MSLTLPQASLPPSTMNRNGSLAPYFLEEDLCSFPPTRSAEPKPEPKMSTNPLVLIAELYKLEQTGSVLQYANKVDTYISQLSWPSSYAAGAFTRGLKSEIKHALEGNPESYMLTYDELKQSAIEFEEFLACTAWRPRSMTRQAAPTPLTPVPVREEEAAPATQTALKRKEKPKSSVRSPADNADLVTAPKKPAVRPKKNKKNKMNKMIKKRKKNKESKEEKKMLVISKARKLVKKSYFSVPGKGVGWDDAESTLLHAEHKHKKLGEAIEQLKLVMP